MSSAGQIFSAVVAAAFVGIVTVPFFALLRWRDRKSEERKHEAAEKQSAEYADEFKRREVEFEESLKKPGQ